MKNRYVWGGALVILCGMAAAFLYSGSINGLANVIASQNTTPYASCISTFLEVAKKDFIITEVELNGDEQRDALVQYTSEHFCGSAGCVYEICVSTREHTYTHVPFGYAAEDIAVTQTKTNDMYDLVLNEDKNLTMTWDGSQYLLQE